jgi:hypothetical protein
MNGTRQFLVSPTDKNVLRDNIIDASKEVRLEVNTENPKHVLMSHQYNNKVTNFMKLSPSRIAASHAALKNFPIFMEPESSLPCSKEPSTDPYPEPDQSIPPHPISL